MVALARRVFVRPKLDEACPEWARDLIPLSEQEHGLGVPYDRIPQATLAELEYFFPAPVAPKRLRRSGAQNGSKKYARTCGLAVFLACLPFALAKQLDLFADETGEATGEVAVLGFRKLADLAKNVGMSYDRLQRWMTVLLTLGFIWRFRDRKRTLYVIPLSAYAPRPSAEGVRTKLTALIHSQFVEVEQADGQVIRVDRCPEFTNLLLETRARFEQRYQLAPSLDLDLLEDPTWENTLRDIQQALPDLSRSDLYTIVPIIARHFLQQGSSSRGRRFVLKRNTIESTLSIETLPNRERGAGDPSGQRKRDRAQTNKSVVGIRGSTESTFDEESLLQAANTGGTGAAQPSTGPVVSRLDHVDDKSRFDQKAMTAPPGPSIPSQAASSQNVEEGTSASNLLLSTAATSLTSGSTSLEDAAPGEQEAQASQEQDTKQERWQELGAEIARIFDDQKSVKFYVSVFRQAKDEQLVRAVFVKTLYQEQHGGFTRSAGAYFKHMWDEWRVYRNFAAACAKWNHWGNRRDPKGIPPTIRDLVTSYAGESLAQIATKMGHRMPQAEQESWVPMEEGAGGDAQPMTQSQAEELVEAVLRYARWYLRHPRICREPALGPDAHLVEACWPDGQFTVFASYDEWLLVHEQMLELPEEIAQWFENERQAQIYRPGDAENGMSAQDREACVHVTLARYAYYGWNATSLSWEDLVTLGRPLLGPPSVFAEAEAAQEGPRDLVVEDGQFYMRMEDGDLVSFEYDQRAHDLQISEQRQEEEEHTYEGVLAALQAELLLGFHLSLLRTFGLSTYRLLAAAGGEQTESGPALVSEGAEGEMQAGLEEAQTASACEGMRLGPAWLCLLRLRRTLDPRCYQVRWQPVGLGSCIIEVESLLSGQTYPYDRADQVEQALAGLRAGDDAEVS